MNYTFIRGRSTYKIGYEYQAINTEIDDFNPTFGQDTYNGYFSYGGTGQGSKQNTGTKEGAAVADFLFGARDSFQLNNFVVVHLNQRMNFPYFQDDIRVSSRLTVNAGLRYEIVTPQWESQNRLSNFDPGTNSLIQAKSGSIYDRALVNMPKLDFAPRLGFSYSLDPKTVVRSPATASISPSSIARAERTCSSTTCANIVNTNLVQVPQFALKSQQTTAPLTPCTTAQATAAYDSTKPHTLFPHIVAGISHRPHQRSHLPNGPRRAATSTRRLVTSRRTSLPAMCRATTLPCSASSDPRLRLRRLRRFATESRSRSSPT